MAPDELVDEEELVLAKGKLNIMNYPQILRLVL